jgi:hypothetical protein
MYLYYLVVPDGRDDHQTLQENHSYFRWPRNLFHAIFLEGLLSCSRCNGAR